MAMAGLQRPAYAGFYRAVRQCVRSERHREPAVRSFSASRRWRAAETEPVASTSARFLPSAGMSSFIAPLKHDNTAFMQATMENLMDETQQELSPAQVEVKRREGFPGLALALNRISRGQILRPMSTFLDVAAPQIMNPADSHIARIDAASVQAMLHALSNTALDYNSRDYTHVVQESRDTRLWKPAQLPAAADTSRMPVGHLCLYALATVYDVACQLNITISQECLARTIRALASSNVDLRTFGRCVSLLFLQLSGVPFHEAQLLAADSSTQFRLFDARRMDAIVVAAAIDGFGTFAKPELGETLLRWWSAARRSANGTHTVTAHMPSKTAIEATCWYDSEPIWNALFRARSLNDDVYGARHWLQEYRRLFPRTHRSAWMYREYARLCTVSPNVEVLNIDEDLNSDGEPFKLTALREVMKMISDDDVRFDDILLSIYLNSLIGFRKLDEAASLLHEAFTSGRLPSLPVGLCKAVFRLHRLHLTGRTGGKGAFSKAIEAGPEISAECHRDYGPYHDPRSYTVHVAPLIQHIDSAKRKKNSPALKEALQCALVHGDLPLALFVLDNLQCGSFLLGQKSSDMVLRWLPNCQDGRSAVLGGARLDAELQRRSRLALHSARTHLLQLTSSVTLSEREDDSGYSLVRRAIGSTLVRDVRRALSYDEETRLRTCSGWLCALSQLFVERPHDSITEEETMQAAIRQVTSPKHV